MRKDNPANGPLVVSLRPATSPLCYDLNLLATTVQGLLNRSGPRVIIDNPSVEKPGEILGTSFWLDRTGVGESVTRLDCVSDLLRAHLVEIPGLVVFDPDLPASSNAAVSLAAKEGLAVTGPDGLIWLKEKKSRSLCVTTCGGSSRARPMLTAGSSRTVCAVVAI